jgi:hypothetical protein
MDDASMKGIVAQLKKEIKLDLDPSTLRDVIAWTIITSQGSQGEKKQAPATSSSTGRFQEVVKMLEDFTNLQAVVKEVADMEQASAGFSPNKLRILEALLKLGGQLQPLVQKHTETIKRATEALGAYQKVVEERKQQKQTIAPIESLPEIWPAILKGLEALNEIRPVLLEMKSRLSDLKVSSTIHPNMQIMLLAQLNRAGRVIQAARYNLRSLADIALQSTYPQRPMQVRANTSILLDQASKYVDLLKNTDDWAYHLTARIDETLIAGESVDLYTIQAVNRYIQVAQIVGEASVKAMELLQATGEQGVPPEETLRSLAPITEPAGQAAMSDVAEAEKQKILEGLPKVKLHEMIKSPGWVTTMELFSGLQGLFKAMQQGGNGYGLKRPDQGYTRGVTEEPI